MGFISELKAAIEVYKEARKHTKGLGLSYHDTPKERLVLLLREVSRGKDPTVAADNIASILREMTSDLRDMPSTEFHAFLEHIIQALLSSLEMVYPLWRNKHAFLVGLDEVWIACEPMLDLVKDDGHAYDRLLQQLGVAKRICYFQTSEHYVAELQALLTRNSVPQEYIDKLLFVELRSPYIPPVALYLTTRGRFAMEGKWQPDLRREANGEYRLASPLPVDWLTYATPNATNSHFETLSTYLIRSTEP